MSVADPVHDRERVRAIDQVAVEPQVIFCVIVIDPEHDRVEEIHDREPDPVIVQVSDLEVSDLGHGPVKDLAASDPARDLVKDLARDLVNDLARDLAEHDRAVVQALAVDRSEFPRTTGISGGPFEPPERPMYTPIFVFTPIVFHAGMQTSGVVIPDGGGAGRVTVPTGGGRRHGHPSAVGLPGVGRSVVHGTGA